MYPRNIPADVFKSNFAGRLPGCRITIGHPNTHSRFAYGRFPVYIFRGT
jgi:hypothetical protein